MKTDRRGFLAGVAGLAAAVVLPSKLGREAPRVPPAALPPIAPAGEIWTVRTATVCLPVTDELLEDAQDVRAMVDGHLHDCLRRMREDTLCS